MLDQNQEYSDTISNDLHLGLHLALSNNSMCDK